MMRKQSILAALLTSGALCAIPVMSHAQSVVSVGAEVHAEAGYAANPFTIAAGETGSGFAKISLSPQAKIESERSVVTISGTAEYQRYFRRYGDLGNYNAVLDYSGTPTERVKTHLRLRYDNSIIGRNDQILGAVDPTLPSPPVTSGPDLSLFGTRARRQSLGANGDVSIDLSARDSVAIGGFYIRSRYAQFGALGNNDGFGGSANYSRQVSERVRLGVQAAIARYNYSGLLGDTTVYSIQPSISATLGSGWKADGALGVSFVDSPAVNKRAVFSGNLRLCNASTRSNLCINAARAVLPTGITGVQNTTSLDASYSYKITEYGTLFGAAGYTRNDSSLVAGVQSNEFVRGSLGYARVIKKDIRLTISGQYRKVLGGLIERGADYGVQAGVVVGFGGRR